ncbi:MAG: cytochrome b/b6 domain-containing protein [Pseudomonadota bacterium]|nr:cytochrome b/b6 domain-containing protein [Pseudomonadota bacterium]
MNDAVTHAPLRRVRVWDLPTRLFHWLLALLVVASIVTAHVGGGAMAWHFRSGYAIFTVLLFRLVWGFVGGRWSRFDAFVRGPGAALRYVRGTGLAHEHHGVGHSPVGGWSVLLLLGILAAQVATGLVADDEVAANGPLLEYVSSATSSLATRWHRNIGQWSIVGLALLHVGAVSFYWLRLRQNLVAPMLHGDKHLTMEVPATVDTMRSRLLALALVLGCAVLVATLVVLS